METVETSAGVHEAVRAPSGRGRGRPTKFTPETQATILRGIRLGWHLEDACQAAGVHYATFREWMLASEAGDPQYGDFSEAVHQAELIAKRRLLKTVRRAAKTEWRPALKLLAVRWPDQYADQSRRTVQHTGTITVQHEHLLTGLDLDAVRGLLQPPADPSIIEGTAHEVDESTP